MRTRFEPGWVQNKSLQRQPLQATPDRLHSKKSANIIEFNDKIRRNPKPMKYVSKVNFGPSDL